MLLFCVAVSVNTRIDSNVDLTIADNIGVLFILMSSLITFQVLTDTTFDGDKSKFLDYIQLQSLLDILSRMQGCSKVESCSERNARVFAGLLQGLNVTLLFSSLKMLVERYWKS